MSDREQNPSFTEALEEFTQAIREDKVQRALNAKQARTADKLLIAEMKANRKNSGRKPAGFTKRVGRRAVGGVGRAVGGAIGGALGSIPIAGTILRVLGQEFRNARFDKKTFQKSLKQRRKVEIREMDRMAKVKAKLDSKAEERQDKKTGGGPEGGPTTSRAIEKLADAAMHLQATSISMTPAIETFHETVEKMAEVVEKMEGDSSSKITDAQALEYLHAIDYFTQESVTIAERNEGVVQTIGKDISNIKWHMARANGSTGRIEKLIKENTSGKIEVKADPELKKDVGTIKWHVARANGSVGRIEKVLQQAANDRLKILETEKEQLKTQEKQLETQDTGNMIGAIGAITNLFGGTGTLAAGVMATGAAITLGVGAAAALGYEIGKVINDWLPDNEFTDNLNVRFGMAVDRILAFFGDDEAKDRLKLMEGETNLEQANRTDAALGNSQAGFETHGEQWQQDYARKNGEFDIKQRRLIRDPTSLLQYTITEPMYQHEAEARERELDAQANQLGQQSAEVSDSKNAPAMQSAGTNIQAATQSTVTNNTVTQQPISTHSDRNGGRSLTPDRR